MTASQIILSIGAAFVLVGIVGWCLISAGKLGEDDIEEVFPDPPARTSEDRHEWRNNSAKVPHAD